MKLSASDLVEQGIVDRIVPEPQGGAHRNHAIAADTLINLLREELKVLKKLKPEKLVQKRIEKFSAMGRWAE